MVRSRGRGGFRPTLTQRIKCKVTGVRVAWRSIDDGEFFCTGCGGDRSYQLLEGMRRVTVLGVPLRRHGTAGPVVCCSGCRHRFPVADLELPTTTRLAALLRDAVHTIALSMLAVDGVEQDTTRRAAVASVRAAGFPECTEERLLTLQAALWEGRVPGRGPVPGASPAGGSGGGPGMASGLSLEPETREALAALAPHLATPGRRELLLHGARVALADGPYLPAERDILADIGATLRLHPVETERLLVQAATASGA
ncbi:TerB family tellurite resistance protein [Streptomyces sp. 4N509B]|uniref:TerB family tellurite resistance protein n=1 Tax=Streptomyces sp. 4N509B TaxID=3457413 RepID=UPI003FD1C66D